jgi:N-acetylglutamate synthase-like GNAT family acetyltransferase
LVKDDSIRQSPITSYRLRALWNFTVITIRPARAEDRFTIRKMIFREGLDPSTLDWRNFNVAEVNGEIAGIAQVKPYRDCREFGSLAVRPQFRRQGVGAALIKASLVQESGDVYLLCVQGRVPYYAKFGFEGIEANDAPRTLRRKLAVARLFAAFGVRVVCMRRERRVQ